MVTLAEITNAMLAPFAEQVGMQGFAYGLLGLKTLRKVFAFARERVEGAGDNNNGGDN